jgi:UDPglucose 6-dehydrogenase
MREWESQHRAQDVRFGYSPENLRLGKAIAAFMKPDRVVIGLSSETDRALLVQLFRPITRQIEWMSIESAEMTKHALNAFLATSVAFINEVAVLCEHVGADAKEVARGLKSESRIGPGAYLSPGGAFAGGTLARDILFLINVGAEVPSPLSLIKSVRTSNDAHQQWPLHKLKTILGDLCGQRVAIWGLTYKPGTDTLRRSNSIELCERLLEAGASLTAHDPAVRELPAHLAQKLRLCATPLDAVRDAAALIVATAWPDYLLTNGEALVSNMKIPVVLDPGRFLAGQLESNPAIQYFTVGKP